MCRAPASTAAYATKPRAGNCVAACRSASSGAKYCSILMKPLEMKRLERRYARFSNGFKSSALRVACGYGFAANAWIFHSRFMRQRLFAGLHQPILLLRNPVYAGVYAYGKSRRKQPFDEHGTYAAS
jgi:hypothetical protein